MNRTFSIILTALLATSCQTGAQRTADENGTTARPAASDNDEEKTVDRADEAETLRSVHAAFREADGKAFASHYSEDALMVLSNGTVVRGREALAAAATQSGPSVRRWEVLSPRVHRVENGRYLSGDSRTKLALPDGAELDIAGKRLVTWATLGDESRIRVDLSVPDAPTTVPDAIAAKIESLAAAWNAHDASAAMSVFTESSVYVLSDGRVFEGEGIRGLLQFAFDGEIERMAVSPRSAWAAGEDTIYVSSDYSFRFKPGDEFVEAAGCRLDVWKKQASDWTLLAQVAQPKGSTACIE